MARRRAQVVAVLADIHGNLPALAAVLGEADAAAADAVVLLGDIALGPMPAETLEALAALGERAIWGTVTANERWSPPSTAGTRWGRTVRRLPRALR